MSPIDPLVELASRISPSWSFASLSSGPEARVTSGMEEA